MFSNQYNQNLHGEHIAVYKGDGDLQAQILTCSQKTLWK